MKYASKGFVCEKCGKHETGRKPTVRLCFECFCEHKGVAGHCAVCSQQLPRKRIALKPKSRSGRLYCSRECWDKNNSGETHAQWSGGKIVDANGYARTKVGRRYVFDHRLMMESVLGRTLYAWETVHHKDGDRTNNTVENLELMGSRHPRGQRYADWVMLMLDRMADANKRCIVWAVWAGDVLSTSELHITDCYSGHTYAVPLV
jgi:hypothetical protein